jgi:hypothetical protein
MSTADHSTARLAIGMSPFLAESQPLAHVWCIVAISIREPPRDGSRSGLGSARPGAFGEDTDLGNGRARVFSWIACVRVHAEIGDESGSTVLEMISPETGELYLLS